jgi:hypothetical protein
MPPQRHSRHRFTSGIAEDGVMFLSERVPFLYRDLPDNLQVVVKDGESWFTLAGRYYSALPRGAGFWWVIADFQPEPVHDPTIAIPTGTTVVIPSMRTVQHMILNEGRRRTDV